MKTTKSAFESFQMEFKKSNIAMQQGKIQGHINDLMVLLGDSVELPPLSGDSIDPSIGFEEIYTIIKVVQNGVKEGKIGSKIGQPIMYDLVQIAKIVRDDDILDNVYELGNHIDNINNESA